MHPKSVDELTNGSGSATQQSKTSTIETRINTAASVIAAVTALLTFVTQVREHFIFAWMLLIVVALVLVTNTYRPVRIWFKERSRKSYRDKVVRRTWPIVQAFENRVGRFIDPNGADTIQYLIKDICGHNLDSLAKVCPPDFLPPFFNLIFEKHKSKKIMKEPDFRFAMREINELIWSYNYNYVIRPFERLRSADWKDKVTEEHRRKVEDFRERWVRCLDDFQQLVQDLNNRFGEPIFSTYFERPKQL